MEAKLAEDATPQPAPVFSPSATTPAPAAPQAVLPVIPTEAQIDAMVTALAAAGTDYSSDGGRAWIRNILIVARTVV